MVSTGALSGAGTRPPASLPQARTRLQAPRPGTGWGPEHVLAERWERALLVVAEDLEHDGLALDVLDEGPGHLHCNLVGKQGAVGGQRWPSTHDRDDARRPGPYSPACPLSPTPWTALGGQPLPLFPGQRRLDHRAWLPFQNTELGEVTEVTEVTRLPVGAGLTSEPAHSPRVRGQTVSPLTQHLYLETRSLQRSSS